MGLWFSASAVLPQLTDEWGIDGSERAWMTMSVQIGFVVGALLSALLNLSDRWPAQKLVAVSAWAGAAANAGIVLVDDAGSALVLRFLTGVALAGVYPPGMKLVAGWCKHDRGFGIGLLVGALTLGSASPHLLNALPIFGESGIPPWRPVVVTASVLAAIGGVIAFARVRPGPHVAQTAPFDWRFVGRAITDRPTRLANFGYLGHMWELYAVWAWVPLFLMVSYERAGWDPVSARVAGFAVVGIGGLGSILAGVLADRVGRTAIAIASLGVSGAACLVAGIFFDSPGILTAICLVWGFAVVADSAQFSAAVSELTDTRYVGTALTLQTSLGFLLTLATIRMIPPFVERFGWEWAFAILAIGPAFGIWNMLRLRSLPEARRMASGNR